MKTSKGLITLGFAFGSILLNPAPASADNAGKPEVSGGLPAYLERVQRAVEENSANIADNFAQIQGNRADLMNLDTRLSELEAAGPPGDTGARTFVAVDCNQNADALQAPSTTFFPANTTYEITGRCNGPLFITEDGVRFVGASPDAAIVLPGGIPNPGDGAVFADGANDVRVQNLLIDASAWGSGAVAEGTDAAGVYARNAFVRVIDTRIVGGLWSMNPFRNAIVRTQGLVELVDYVNSGISVGDQSLVSARGPVAMSSNVTDGSYLGAIDIYRGGLIDFRAGVTVNQAPADPSINFYPYAIGAARQSHLRIRNNGTIDIHGDVFLNSVSSANIDGGAFDGDIWVADNSVLQIRNVSRTGNLQVSGGGNVSKRGGSLDGFVSVDNGATLNFDSVSQSGGGMALNLNSSARLNNSFVGLVDAQTGSAFEVFQGALDGANLNTGASAILSGASVNGNITALKPTSLHIAPTFPGSGSLNGNSVFVCDEETVEIDPAIAATGSIVDICP